MITWANLRASAALWMVLPASVYSGLYITANRISVPTAYGVEAGEAVAQTLPVVVGAVAAVAAWEAGRHRLLGTFPATAARSALRRFVWAVTPVVVLQGCSLSFLYCWPPTRSGLCRAARAAGWASPMPSCFRSDGLPLDGGWATSFPAAWPPLSRA